MRTARPLWAAALVVLVACFARDAGLAPSAAAQGSPTVVLSPSSGDAPSVSGSLSGTGWLGTCRGVGVSGSGVSGTAALGPGGTLSGSFTATGSPGDLVTVTVVASCSPSNLTGRANFRFNEATPTPVPTDTPTPTATATATRPPTPTSTPTAAPTPTATPTPAPTSTATASPTGTPTPTATASASSTATATPGRLATPTPTAASAVSPTPTPVPVPVPVPVPPGVGRVVVLGCQPDPANVHIRLDAVGGVDPPAGSLTLSPPATRGAAPGAFDFPLPADAPATLYSISAEILDPDCPPGAGAQPGLFVPSDSFTPFVVPMGQTTLDLSTLGGQIPAGEFGKWVTFYERQGTLESWRQAVRTGSTTKFDSVRWQVSLQPFSSDVDPLNPSPEGLLASGDVSCAGTCIFVIEFEKFMPQKAASKAALNWPGETTGLFFEVLNLLPAVQKPGNGGGSSGVTTISPAPAVPAFQPAPNLNLVAPLNIYFRTIPSAKGVLAGPASNTAIFRWTGPFGGPDPGSVTIPDCTKTPKPTGCIQPPKTEPPGFEVEIIAYHGWIPSKSGHYGCYIVTKTTTVTFPVALTYHAGDKLCPPAPDEPSFFEAVVNFVTDAVNWVANTYNALKKQVVSFVAKFVPGDLCPPSCIETLLNAGLMALGIPPSLPNFDELMNQGVDYLAEQAAEQIGVPKEVQALGDAAVDEFKKQVKQKFKDGIEAGLAEMQKSLSTQVSWIPDGVPIKPDPLGDYQPPAITIKVTGKTGVPACTPGSLGVGGWGYNTTPGGKKELGNEAWAYLYEGVGVPVPPLAAGESVVIPVTFKPHLSWGFPGAKYTSWNDAVKGWSAIYYGGTVTLRAIGGPCLGGDTLSVASEGSYP